MKIKFFAVSVAAVVVGSFMFACSSSSNGSGGGSSCPAVGYAACKNDTPTTQADVDSCNKCLSQYQAAQSCAQAQGAPATPSCDANGNDVEPSQDVETKESQNCGSQLAALLSCVAANEDGG